MQVSNNLSNIVDSVGTPSNDFATALVRQFRAFGINQHPMGKGYIAPGIPPKKLQNASAMHGGIQGQALALIDLTLLGSAKNHILFTTEGLYFSAANATPNAGFLPYSQFANCYFSKKSLFDPRINTGMGIILPLVGPKGFVDAIGLLDRIKSLKTSHGSGSTKFEITQDRHGDVVVPLSRDEILERAYNMEQAKNWDEAIRLYEDAGEYRMAGLAREQKIRWEQSTHS